MNECRKNTIEELHKAAVALQRESAPMVNNDREAIRKAGESAAIGAKLKEIAKGFRWIGGGPMLWLAKPLKRMASELTKFTPATLNEPRYQEAVETTAAALICFGKALMPIAGHLPNKSLERLNAVGDRLRIALNRAEDHPTYLILRMLEKTADSRASQQPSARWLAAVATAIERAKNESDED